MGKHFRMPPFIKEDPKMWLVQVECAFRAAGIGDDDDKYWHFVANADQDVLSLIAHMVNANEAKRRPPMAYHYGSYFKLREAIVTKYDELGKEKFVRLFKGSDEIFEVRKAVKSYTETLEKIHAAVLAGLTVIKTKANRKNETQRQYSHHIDSPKEMALPKPNFNY